GQEFIAEFRIDMEESHTCNAVGAIFPGVICAALNDDIALFQNDFAVFENENDLALDDYGVVERLRPMHHGSASTVLERIHVDDSHQMTRVRHDGEVTIVRFALGQGGELGNEIGVTPHFEEIRADGGAGHLVVLRGLPVRDYDGFPGFVMTGHYTSG